MVMEQPHGVALAESGADPSRIRLLRSFDPDTPSATPELNNPYSATDFAECFTVIEAALPGLHGWVDQQLEGTNMATKKQAAARAKFTKHARGKNKNTKVGRAAAKRGKAGKRK